MKNFVNFLAFVSTQTTPLMELHNRRIENNIILFKSPLQRDDQLTISGRNHFTKKYIVRCKDRVCSNPPSTCPKINSNTRSSNRHTMLVVSKRLITKHSASGWFKYIIEKAKLTTITAIIVNGCGNGAWYIKLFEMWPNDMQIQECWNFDNLIRWLVSDVYESIVYYTLQTEKKSKKKSPDGRMYLYDAARKTRE